MNYVLDDLKNHEPQSYKKNISVKKRMTSPEKGCHPFGDFAELKRGCSVIRNSLFSIEVG